jgi:lipopolysaccharide/colanic/teichoic acid biosynthesis glycosyltransferase
MTETHRMIKRSIDLTGAVLGLISGLPVVGIAALAIWIEDHGPVFFCQTRAGEGGRPFIMYKLRSMRVGAENQTEEIDLTNPSQRPLSKFRMDPRVTRVGRFLRRWSIDEIPQFYNVFRGEMSLVGPRPEETRIVSQYTSQERLRLAIKPGITGPMQVNGRADLDFEQRMQLELQYIDHCSIWIDFKIMLQTIGAVINGKGSY